MLNAIIPAMTATTVLEQDRYLVRKKVFTILGAKFHIYNDDGELLLFTRQKALKLKEDLRLYSDETEQHELMRIGARQVLDFGATYEVIDSTNDEHVGAVRRKGFKSMVRDSWTFLDADGREIATLSEDSAAFALLRRFVEVAALVFPQKFHVQMNGRTVGTYRQLFNPFVQKIQVDFSEDTERALDRRLVLAGAVLIAAIEGRQN